MVREPELEPETPAVVLPADEAEEALVADIEGKEEVGL